MSRCSFISPGYHSEPSCGAAWLTGSMASLSMAALSMAMPMAQLPVTMQQLRCPMSGVMRTHRRYTQGHTHHVRLPVPPPQSAVNVNQQESDSDQNSHPPAVHQNPGEPAHADELGSAVLQAGQQAATSVTPQATPTARLSPPPMPLAQQRRQVIIFL